jgi:hypothetical protein
MAEANRPEGASGAGSGGPHLVAMTEMVSATPERASLDFEFGLDLILDGLDRLRPTRDRTRLTSR